MRKTLRILVAVLSILVAALAIFSLFFRIGELKTSGERSSGAEYSILRNELMAMQTKESLNDQLFRDKLVALYRGSQRLLAAQVLDANGFVAWKIPADSAYFALPNAVSARSGFAAPESSTVVFTTTLNDGMRLSALYASVRRSDIAQAAKVPLIVIAIWCLAVALAFLLLGEERKDSLLPDVIDTSKIDLSVYAPEPEIKPEGDAGKPGSETNPEPETAEAALAPAAPVEKAAEEAAAEETPPAAEAARPEAVKPWADTAEAPIIAASTAAAAATQIAATQAAVTAQPAEARAQPQATPKTEAPAQSFSDAARSGRTFEESLAKLEEEIVEWTNRHPERAAKIISEQAAAAKPASESAIKSAAPADVDQELDEEIAELEAPPEEEAAGSEDMTLADSMETLEEFEELNAEGEERQEASAERGHEAAPLPALAPAAESPREQPAQAREAAAQPQERQDLATLPMSLSLSDSQLEARLNEELGRNIRTDISLMLIHCAVSSRSDPAAVALAVTVKDYIGSKDLIFELYKGAFAVVLPSVDLGGALKMSEDLADVLSATLSLYRDIEGEAPVYIGISARSDRRVDAYKIYREASTAVHKAYSGSHSRILAFRPKAE